MNLPGSTGKSSPEWTASAVKLAVFMLIFTPILFTLFAPAHIEHPYEQEISELETAYYNSNGHDIPATTEIWPLVGIYTPYSGGDYGVSPDSWVYGSMITDYAPAQYGGGYEARLMDNGLYYYTAVPSTDKTHIAAEYIEPVGEPGYWDYSNASIYANVHMDNAHKSTVFFTTDSKVITDEGFYYSFTGYRMAFSPIRAFEANDGGVTIQIQPRSASLSLIWYQYSTLDGLAGMLSIQGNDYGLSYITGDMITREFNSATYSSVFDMTFNNLKCHLSIRLDPEKVAAGMTPADAYNYGYWSVMVTSDAIASSNLTNATYEFNPDNVLQTLFDLLTFNVAKDYDIGGWEATIASLLITMPLWAALIALALSNYYILIGVALLAAIQTLGGAITSWWPF